MPGPLKYCATCGAPGHEEKSCPLRRLQEQQEFASVVKLMAAKPASEKLQ